jgi:Big-like domain-containing protein
MKALLSFLIILPAVLNAAPQTVESPKIVATTPAFWAVRVDPGLKTVSLTFDQQMIPAFTDWLGRSSLPPNTDIGSSTMTPDRKTFQLTVHMVPAKTYVFALNEKGIQGVGFQNDKGVSAAPTFLVFQTAGTPKPEDAPPVVVRTNPPHGAQQLDPRKLTGLSITFDRPMRPERHGLHLLKNGAAVDVSKLRFGYSADRKTFTLFATFDPVSTYRADLNSTSDIGFASATRIPLWPTTFSFTTGQPQ